jgi:hypothetical protein
MPRGHKINDCVERKKKLAKNTRTVDLKLTKKEKIIVVYALII